MGSIIRAERRAQAVLKDHRRAVAARYENRGERIVIAMRNGVEFAVPVALVQELAGFRPADLRDIEINSLDSDCTGRS